MEELTHHKLRIQPGLSVPDPSRDTEEPGGSSIERCHLTSIGNPIMEITRSYDRLISPIGFPILVRWHHYIESGSMLSRHTFCVCIQIQPLYFFCGLTLHDGFVQDCSNSASITGSGSPVCVQHCWVVTTGYHSTPSAVEAMILW